MSGQISSQELSDDIEVIGPGIMLKEGREKLGLSQEDVAQRLNFRKSLVREIEDENFPSDVPSTFTRGYLKNYAKLVDVPVDEVLASFEMLGVAKAQGAEMQSFSRQTEKQAENSRLMWLSYFIVAVLIGLTILWWIQNNAEIDSAKIQPAPEPNVQQTKADQVSERSDETTKQTQLAQEALDQLVESVNQETNTELNEPQPQEIEQAASLTAESDAAVSPNSSTVVFTFAGDCWVNIYDSTGERIAWGIKKADYVMTISGVPPFSITLGKPEQVAITYNDQIVDMSRFSAGHIAKFELPLNE